MKPRLFVYGTLRRGVRNTRAALLGSGARCLARARVRGRLYDLGEYPGLVGSDADEWVHGEVFELPDAGALARLDAYEGCGPGDPPPHEFERAECEALLESGERVRVYVYVYCGPVDEGRRIRSGDYAER